MKEHTLSASVGCDKPKATFITPFGDTALEAHGKL
jgi:hypothetical protein